MDENTGRPPQCGNIAEPAGSGDMLALFFQVAELLPNPVGLLDANNCYLACNGALARFFGTGKREVIGKPVFHALPQLPSDTPDQWESPDSAPDGSRLETRCRTSSGNEFEIIVTAARVSCYDGAPGILYVITDISELKQVEQELRKAAGMLEAVIKASPLPITMVDTDFFVRLWNPAAERCFGFSREEVIDKIYPLWPDRDKEAAEALKRFNNDEVLYGSEVLRKRSDGTVIRVKRYTSPVRDLTGALIGTMAVLEDLTEQRRTESELLQAGKMAAIGELAAGIAHEINNPNMFMMTNAQIAAEIWQDGSRILKRHTAEHTACLLAGLPLAEALESMPKLLGGIVEGSFRIQRIVDTLKDFCRQEEHAGSAPVNIARVLESSVVMLENQIRQRTDRFSLQCEDGLPQVLGVFHQLEQVIINLVLNALQSLRDRSGAVTLAASHDRHGGMVEIVLRDEGCGMTPETLKRILDPFFTTRLERGGLGLGLSISSRIIRRHGGTLRFESSPGRGTTAVIRLPAVQDAESEGTHA